MKKRHIVFVNEYIKDFNASRAAVAAGYAKENADVTGPRLLRSVGIKDAVDQALEERKAASAITIDKLEKKLWKIASVELEEIIDWYGKGAVVKVSDIVKAIELLLKTKGALRDKPFDVKNLTREQLKALITEWMDEHGEEPRKLGGSIP